MTLYCGTGKIEITPKTGAPLAGYAEKERNATDVHDPLFARVVAIKKAEQTFLVISLDVVGIDQSYFKKLSQKINHSFQIPENNIFIHATHTHSGPGGLFDDSSLIVHAYPFMNGYLPFTEKTAAEQHTGIIQAIEQAVRSMEPCQLYYGERRAEGIAANRNSPALPYDSGLQVVEFRYHSGKRAILYHFACHPTILHSKSTSVSADLPGVTSGTLENKEDIQLALFLNGPSADISTRFTRRESSFEEVERLGNKLAAAVAQLLEETTERSREQVESSAVPIQLEVRKIPELQHLQKQVDELTKKQQQLAAHKTSSATLRQLEAQMEGMQITMEIGNKLDGIKKVETFLQVLRIGSCILLSVPGELYFEAGQNITQSFDMPILVIGNTNDYIGYIVPSRYYAENSYESFVTLLEKGANEKIISASIQLIQKILTVG